MVRERGRVFLGRISVGSQLGKAEIEHFDRPVSADDHVGRLEVAVDDAARVCCGEASATAIAIRSASFSRIPGVE
jgi:hypothetical protein